MRQQTMWLSSFGMGAATAFLFDPSSGRRRRHRVADAATHLVHRTSDGASTVGRDLRNRTQGVITSARHRFRDDHPDDVVLIERVHSALGRMVSHPHAITVNVCDGHVTLDGPIRRSDRDRILHAVRAIPGVTHVVTQFDRHIQPASGSIAQPGVLGRRVLPRPDIFQRNWAPATRAIVGGSGAALVGFGLVRGDRTGLGLAAVGAALVARAATNLPVRQLLGVGRGARHRRLESLHA